MQLPVLVLSVALPFAPVADSAAGPLDTPSNSEATAAYRAIPAVAREDSAAQQETAEIKSCAAAFGEPGVVCKTGVKKAPDVPAQDVTIHFARGPDSAWVATLEQKAP